MIQVYLLICYIFFRLLDIKDDDSDLRSKPATRNSKGGRRSAPTPEMITRSKQEIIDLSEDTSESSTTIDDDYNQYEDLFTAVMTATDQENKPLHTEFQLLPSKKKYPKYYEVIEAPIDLKTIATKIQNNEYAALADMERDLLLMTKNACLFNEPGSVIYKNAKTLKKVFYNSSNHNYINFEIKLNYRLSQAKKLKLITVNMGKVVKE